MAQHSAVPLDLLARYGASARLASETGGTLSTGFAALDAALGIGGLPRGRIVEITGDDAGTLSLALGLLAPATQAGGLAAIVDPARTFYPPSALAAGVQLANLVVVQPAGLAPALEAIATLLRTEGFDVVIYDLPRGGKEPTGSQLTRLAAAAMHARTLLLVLTAGTPARVSSPTNRPLGYFASIRLHVERRDCCWRRGPDGQPLELAGYRLGVTVLKHKLAAPRASVEIDIASGEERPHGSTPDRLPVAPPFPGLGDAATEAGARAPGAYHRRDAG